MNQAVRFSRSFWLPLSTGLAWILCGEGGGLFGLAYAVPPAVVCVAAAFLGLSAAEVKRATQLAALGGALGVVFGVLALFLYGFAAGVLLLALSSWAFVDAGSNAAKNLESLEEVPSPDLGLSFSAKVALDEALLGAISFLVPTPEAQTEVRTSARSNENSGESELARIEREVGEACELFETKGWLEKPEEYHRTPLPLEVPGIQPSSVRTLGGRVEFESLSFESEYEPMADEPGRERWLGYVANRTASAHVLRHPGEPRPWIICIHGYQMGKPIEDFGVFDPRVLHRKYGFNMLLPTLPLHGPRKIGRISGDGFLSGDILDSIHAASQGVWDIRRLISWVRTQDAPSIGVYGLSLGGYTASLLTGVESGLDFVIAGIPMTSLTDTFWRHLPDPVVRGYLEAGLSYERLEQVTRVVSPLALAPKVPHEGRAIFGGVGDRLVAPRQVRDLARHWDHPATVWYQGSHVTFFFDSKIRQLIEDTVKRSSN
jgi:hypothetical protein